MVLYNNEQAREFDNIVGNANGSVWMQEGEREVYDLNNKTERDAAIREMLDDKDNDLELYASDRYDEGRLINFLSNRQKAA